MQAEQDLREAALVLNTLALVAGVATIVTLIICPGVAMSAEGGSKNNALFAWFLANLFSVVIHSMRVVLSLTLGETFSAKASTLGIVWSALFATISFYWAVYA